MGTHEPHGPSVCIHAVVVQQAHQRRGVALALLKEYVNRLQGAENEGYEKVLLICHEELRDLYEKAGFEYVGPSEVVHGTKAWIELRIDLKAARQQSGIESSLPSDLGLGQSLPPDVLQALQGFTGAQSSQPAPPKTLLSSIAEGLPAVTLEQSNKYDILCPREICRSVIIKAGVGQLVEESLIQVCVCSSAQS